MTLRERLAKLDGTVAARLGATREDDTRRRVALAAAVIVGFAFAWVHWVGLVVGGALVGLTQRGVGRAVAAALGFGTITVLVTIFVTPTLRPTGLVELSRLTAGTIGTGLVLPAWGALIRGVV